jgi:hypothetical protein
LMANLTALVYNWWNLYVRFYAKLFGTQFQLCSCSRLA